MTPRRTADAPSTSARLLTEDALTELDRPIVDCGAQDERPAANGLAQDRIDVIDRGGDRARAVDPLASRVDTARTRRGGAQGVGPEIAADLEVGPSHRPQSLHQLVRGNIEPDHVPAAGTDGHGGPCRRRSGPRRSPCAASDRRPVRQRAARPRRHPVGGPGSPVRSTNLAPAAFGQRPSRHLGHRCPAPRPTRLPWPTYYAALDAAMRGPGVSARTDDIPLDRRLRFRNIGPCPTLWNGAARTCHRSATEDGGPEHEHTVHSGHGRVGGALVW